ncbi:MAG: nuclear transport factor 2 family protein [Proteobacteria bacterium]|jgi:SnoaL-like domain|nr:nuclear transport factor 2 family protein [Pseudomonadota bacterium]MBK9253630.1 nuclear transport factor 2 family protein [Pseudomonadota bacterium]MCC6630491.1 nuclear transport factor 2 family protein [Gammaproteobacteria bacterium]
MNAQELADIEACRSLIVEFATRIDDGRAHTLGDLMTMDASFARPTVPDVVIEGRDAILAAFSARPKHLISQHLNLNIRIRLTGADTAEGHSVVMLFLADANDELVTGKGRKTGAPIIGTWTDTFVRTADGWRFKDRRGMATLHG